MKPVNLLPAELRTQVPTGDGRSGYIALGVLGVLLLMMLGWVLTGNSVTSRKGEIADVNKQTARAKQQASAQSAFGDFHQIKETRVSSVSQLANDRFDWERLVRELSLVLPTGTSVTELSASKGPQAEGSASTSPSSSSTGSTDASASGLPSLHLLGCAAKQHNVAVMLVRLRQMHDVDDVELAESSEQVPESAGGSSGSSGGSGDSASGAGDGCAPKTFKFDVTVTFKELAPVQGGNQRVPTRLGGGS
jgi:Tfp pilus assembly protein PilN